MEAKTFRNISLNADLVDEIEKFIVRNKHYRSIAEFVAEAARLRLEALSRKGA